ncbi:hypothetical protein [Hymenobacter wooponensis]|uniref:Secreted protein n=1 Tax=Hymenobacter wooponensis TaxID=1525360 RepID=A0A4Z0MII6_9BACT|nr:hypothetical protein [Hymenobacter wooponensis]TGD79336.1 hypothetical protein EU557_13945 [Hymenobacter wooponensis]
MKHTLYCLYLLLLALFASTASAKPTGLSAVDSKGMLVVEGAVQNDQGDKTPATARPSEQSSPEPPVKAVPMTERKSKPQRVDARGTESARGPREVRSARGGRGSEAGRGAQGGGGRGVGRGIGRGHGN